MPLLKGPGTLGTNISEILKSYREKGSIGTSRPPSIKKAQKQAIAIAYKQQGKQ